VRRTGPSGRSHDPRGRGVTASSDSPVDKLPPDSLSAQLPDKALSETGLEDPVTDGQPLPQTRLQIWLHRVLILLFVFVCAAMGVLLVILPWRPEWTDNHFLLGSPGLRTFVSNGFVRGLCSGLGLLDIWIGFWEAVHYHDETRH
jgi:hypothetical protein